MIGSVAKLPPVDAAELERSYGLSSESVAVLRALADVLVPAVDGCPSGGAAGAHLRAAQSLEMVQRGSTTLLTRLLNMYARSQRRGARFLDLDDPARGRAFRALSEEDLDEMRDAVESVHAFILDGYLGGWSTAGSAERPKVWDVMGFHGPAAGHLDFRDA